MSNLFESLDTGVKRNIAAGIAAGSLMLLAACGPAESASSDPSQSQPEQCSQSSDGLVDVTGICEQIISARSDH